MFVMVLSLLASLEVEQVMSPDVSSLTAEERYFKTIQHGFSFSRKEMQVLLNSLHYQNPTIDLLLEKINQNHTDVFLDFFNSSEAGYHLSNSEFITILSEYMTDHQKEKMKAILLSRMAICKTYKSIPPLYGDPLNKKHHFPTFRTIGNIENIACLGGKYCDQASRMLTKIAQSKEVSKSIQKEANNALFLLTPFPYLKM